MSNLYNLFALFNKTDLHYVTEEKLTVKYIWRDRLWNKNILEVQRIEVNQDVAWYCWWKLKHIPSHTFFLCLRASVQIQSFIFCKAENQKTPAVMWQALTNAVQSKGSHGCPLHLKGY